MSCQLVPSARLRAAIEAAYDVFAPYELHGNLTVCDCPVCVAPQTRAALIATPLHDISSGLLAELTHSAHGTSPDDEIRHFLPRYLDLILRGEIPCHYGTEYTLQKLAPGWRDRWPEDEAAVLGNALDALLEAALTLGERLAREPIGDVLAMLLRADADPVRLGPVFSRVETPFATRRLAEAIVWYRHMAASRPHRAEPWRTFLAWARSREPTRRLEAALSTAGPEDEDVLLAALMAD